MKKQSYLVAIAALLAVSAFAVDKKESNVTVSYQDPDKFTDARSSWGTDTDKGYLEDLSSHIQKTAGRTLPAGQKLEVTIKDIDLAGEFLPTRPELNTVRIVKEIYTPKISLTFKLTDANGTVIKEGERRLTDLNFMSNISLIDRNQPLYHDKAMLTEWIRTEFKK